MHMSIQTARRPSILGLLQLATKYNRLAKLCPSRNGRRGFYALKHQVLSRAICARPNEFTVDEIDLRSRLAVGLTHLPSAWRLHACPFHLSGAAQVLLHAKARASGLDYSLFRQAAPDVRRLRPAGCR